MRYFLKTVVSHVRKRPDEYLSIRFSTRNLPATLTALSRQYAAAMPYRPFEYFFADDYFANLYHSEAVFGRIFTDFLRPILLALLAGAPLAWMLIQSWLHHYAYRIHPGAGLFLFTAGILVASVIGTVSYHATLCALQSPLKVIRKN